MNNGPKKTSGAEQARATDLDRLCDAGRAVADDLRRHGQTFDATIVGLLVARLGTQPTTAVVEATPETESYARKVRDPMHRHSYDDFGKCMVPVATTDANGNIVSFDACPQMRQRKRRRVIAQPAAAAVTTTDTTEETRS